MPSEPGSLRRSEPAGDKQGRQQEDARRQLYRSPPAGKRVLNLFSTKSAPRFLAQIHTRRDGGRPFIFVYNFSRSMC